MEYRRILVTGAGGFIGSHLVHRLVEERATVRAFVRYNSRGEIGLLAKLPDHVKEQVEILAGDLRDASAVHEAMQGIEIVFHLGALIGIPYSYKHAEDVAETNILGTLNVLTAARRHGISRLIHTSSSEVYGSARYVPIDEEHPLQAQSPYAATKIAADKLVESFHRAHGLPTVTVRPFNTYGPGQSARAVIPTIITQALTRSEIRVGNLSPKRDFTFVEDTVSGFLAASQSEKAVGCTINLGTGEEIAIRDLVERIGQLLCKPTVVIQDAERVRPDQSEVTRLLSDNKRAIQLLHWAPRTPLEEGLARTIKWIDQNPDLYSNPLTYHI